MRLLSAAGFTLAVLISAPAFAQDTAPQTGDDDYHTDQAIVVTAPFVRSLDILGDPHLSIVAYGSSEVDVFRVAEVMQAKGWVPGLVQQPKAIHRMMSMLHAPSLDAYLSDVRAAIGVVRQQSGGASSIKASY